MTSASPSPEDPSSHQPSVTVVADADDLEDALAGVSSELVGIDVERADGHRYYRRAALIQVGDESHAVLLDPLAIRDFGALTRFLHERFPVLHALENDLPPLEALGVHVERLADTAVAAAVLGMPTGLGPLIEQTLGVSLSPDKDRFQRADWEQRPLPTEMLEYAAADVFHLPALWAQLDERLEQTGRRSWYEQELAATITAAAEHRRDWKRLRGAGRLSATQRALLRQLWKEREAIGQEHDVAPGRLLRDPTLLDLAVNPAETRDELVRRNRRRTSALRAHSARLFAAQERGRTAQPVPSERSGRFEDRDRKAYDALRRTRAALATELGIDAGLLCPGRALRRAVTFDPQDADELCDRIGLRPWQRALLADRLWQAYTDAHAAASADRGDGDHHDGSHHEEAATGDEAARGEATGDET